MFAVLTRSRKRIARGLALASALFLAACDGLPVPSLGGGGGPQIDPTAAVPVALLIPRSDAGAAPVARALENAARLAVANLDGARIELRVYDTAGDPAQAAAMAQTAVDNGAKIILGPLFAEAAVEASKAVSDEGVNVLAFSNNTTIAGGNLFILGDTFQSAANRLVTFSARQGRRNALILQSNDVAGSLGRQAIESAAARAGVTVAGAESYTLSREGVYAAAQATAARAGAADSIYITTPAAHEALPLLLQLLPENGVRPGQIQYIGLSSWEVQPQIFRLPGAEGAWFTVADPGASQAFAARYQSAYGESPHPLAGLGFDGIAAIGALVSAGRSNALTGAALTQASGFKGSGGIFRLLPGGTNEKGLAVATIQNQRVTIIDPAPKAFGTAGF
ncbi:penicillin-binding protein activator [Mesobacterium pallidum]|uniref:penicillin-binding protein activator n=1 Tax=Mesobacterium pallidum TaxID=2872037 RepID=UPI001EE34FDA|nr:penicillin-binding protein activator [Mesobacterium pallidum]